MVPCHGSLRLGFGEVSEPIGAELGAVLPELILPVGAVLRSRETSGGRGGLQRASRGQHVSEPEGQKLPHHARASCGLPCDGGDAPLALAVVLGEGSGL